MPQSSSLVSQLTHSQPCSLPYWSRSSLPCSAAIFTAAFVFTDAITWISTIVAFRAFLVSAAVVKYTDWPTFTVYACFGSRAITVSTATADRHTFIFPTFLVHTWAIVIIAAFVHANTIARISAEIVHPNTILVHAAVIAFTDWPTFTIYASFGSRALALIARGWLAFTREDTDRHCTVHS